ncbi:MAG: tetratricopeptide repeat protein [Spirochaetes bacterium]|nr:tetratricopeptide repeat protein [Spirochaetota bacterium]
MNRSTRREPGSKPPARPNAQRFDSVQAEVKPKKIDRFAERAERALSSVIFVRLPEEAVLSLGIEGFDVKIPLPVQTPGKIVKFDPSMISPESVMAGILRVLAWQPDHAQAPRYRALIRALRPELLAELSDAGLAKAQTKEWDLVEEILLALEGLYPEAPEPILDLALLREEHAKLLREELNEDRAEEEEDLALGCYRKLLAMEPPFAPAYYHAAFFYLKVKNFDRAVSLFTSFIKRGEDKDKVATAKEALRKLGELGYLDNAFKEAYDFIQMGQEEKGLEHAKAFVERNPGLWNGWFLVGWASRRLGNWADGAEAFEKAAILGSQESDTYNELALCQMELGNLDQARVSLEKALRLEPENVKIIVNLGALVLRMGEKGEALGFFRSALEIDPDDSLAAEWIARVSGGED